MPPRPSKHSWDPQKYPEDAARRRKAWAEHLQDTHRRRLEWSRVRLSWRILTQTIWYAVALAWLVSAIGFTYGIFWMTWRFWWRDLTLSLLALLVFLFVFGEVLVWLRRRIFIRGPAWLRQFIFRSVAAPPTK